MKQRSATLLGGLLLPALGLAQTPATFAPVVAYGTGGSRPGSIVVADVSGDGKPDLLTANYISGTAGVLLGTGDGRFGAATTYITGAGTKPFDIAVADMNEDGKPDLLTTNGGEGAISILLGTGTGGFEAARTYIMGAAHHPSSLAVADVNSDGKMDLLTVGMMGKTVDVRLGRGRGNFAEANSYAVGPGDSPFRSAVTERKGRPDLLTTNTGSATIITSLGTGSFEQDISSLYGGSMHYFQQSTIAVADVNGDGKLDVLTADYNNNDILEQVLVGTGAGSFGTAAGYGNGGLAIQIGAVVADVNGDGLPDLFETLPTEGALLKLGTGVGTFARSSIIYSTGPDSTPNSLAVADVNGDGKPDLLMADADSNTVGVLLNTTPFPTMPATLPGSTITLGANLACTATALAAAGLPVAAHFLEATLYSALGQAVRHLAAPAAAGTAQADIPTAGLPAGVYLLRLGAFDAQGAAVGALPTQRLQVE